VVSHLRQAERFQTLLHAGEAASRAWLARQHGLTRARVTQLMSLLLLHPDILDYVRNIQRQSPRDIVSVYIPEYVVGHWWEQLLHNQSALRLKGRLLFAPGVMVTSVPYQLRSSEGRDEINAS